MLYFASEGWGGFGGLDILQKNLNDDATPINLGYPINSNKDDFGLIKKNKQTGYFSSNRKHGGSDDDLFYFLDKRRDKKKLVVITKVKKLDGSIVALDSVDIEVVDAESKSKVARDTSKGGVPTQIILPTRHQYNVTAKHHDMATLTATVDFEADLVNDDTLELVFIQEEDQLLINGVVKDGTTGKPLANAKVFVYDVNNKTSSVYVSDANGKYAYNAKFKSKYLVKGMHEGYFADCQQVEVKKQKKSANTEPLVLSKIQVNKTFEIKDLYYDYKKWDIRADAALVLDRLVHFLAEYPEIHVELGSHTDARGGDKYNHDLSQSRAASAVNYVVQHGIEAARIKAKGYGETKLLNRCKNNVKCSEEEHQLNRRTEVKVTEVEKDPVAIAKATAISEANVFTNLADFDPCKTVIIGK
jgi:outer membrane protein OmpA-like peptidoglycan-associated protein